MYLEDLTNENPIENRKLECKARLDRNNTSGWLKTITGFLNAEGGTLYIGVEDKTGKLIGFDKGDADNERNYFNNQVNEHVFPHPSMNIEFLRYSIRDKDKYIIKVNLPESEVKPVILRHDGVPAIYMRRDGFTDGATYEEIISMSIKSNHTQYDVSASNIEYDRNNFAALLNFYSKNNNDASLTDKALMSLGFFDRNNMLKKGSLLFADDYKGEKTAVQCSVFSGINRGTERIVTVNRFSGNIIDSITFCMEFIQQRMNHSMHKLGDHRVNIDAYPERSLFEGIINAIAHRDYYIDGSQIQIDMFLDRLEISSPGSFYQGERIEKTYNLSSVISKRRNELICGVFVKCNVMEAAGTGFDKITEDYASADDLHRPYICSTSDHFTLVLPDLTYEKGVEDNTIPEISFVRRKNGSTHDASILSYCYRVYRKSSEISAYLGLSDSTYFRKKILEPLAAENYLIKKTDSGTVRYKTNNEEVSVL